LEAQGLLAPLLLLWLRRTRIDLGLLPVLLQLLITLQAKLP
jgi:hypothetical protein